MDINLDTKNPLFSDDILNKLRYEHTHGGGTTTEYHPTDDIAALFKTRDLSHVPESSTPKTSPRDVFSART